MQSFKINIDKPHKEFLDHLHIVDNKRILLSGRFGIGKTYFIKDFFQEQNGYECTFISPVNYQVAKNEDVLELIKYDVLLEFISKGIVDTNNKEVNELLTMQFYLLNHSSELILDLISLIPKLGKTGPIIKKLIKFIKEYKNYSDEIKKSELDIVEKYAHLIENKEGSIYESDFITQLIFELQERIREKGKESILVLDDLDRIEPEHIFRILNIFSSHFTSDGLTEEDNKFGFDKVIIICDIENIRKIFHSKYGQDVDFSGYIDKFYSKTCFHFDNTSSILNTIGEIFLPFYETNKKFPLVIDLINIVKYFITDFIRTNSINIRDLENIPLLGNPFALKRKFEIETTFNFYDVEIPMIKVLYALREILGNDNHKVNHCFNMCQAHIRDSVIKNRLTLIQNLIPFININQTDFRTENSQSTTVENIELDIKFNFVDSHNINYGRQFETKILSISKSNKPEENINNLSLHDFYFLLKKIYNNIIKITQVEE